MGISRCTNNSVAIEINYYRIKTFWIPNDGFPLDTYWIMQCTYIGYAKNSLKKISAFVQENKIGTYAHHCFPSIYGVPNKNVFFFFGLHECLISISISEIMWGVLSLFRQYVDTSVLHKLWDTSINCHTFSRKHITVKGCGAWVVWSIREPRFGFSTLYIAIVVRKNIFLVDFNGKKVLLPKPWRGRNKILMIN